MVYRSNTLYEILSLISFVITLVLVLSSLSFDLPVRYALLIVSLFFLIMAFAYFHLSHQG